MEIKAINTFHELYTRNFVEERQMNKALVDLCAVVSTKIHPNCLKYCIGQVVKTFNIHEAFEAPRIRSCIFK